jgi:hypothetical protein
MACVVVKREEGESIAYDHFEISSFPFNCGNIIIVNICNRDVPSRRFFNEPFIGNRFSSTEDLIRAIGWLCDHSKRFVNLFCDGGDYSDLYELSEILSKMKKEERKKEGQLMKVISANMYPFMKNSLYPACNFKCNPRCVFCIRRQFMVKIRIINMGNKPIVMIGEIGIVKIYVQEGNKLSYFEISTRSLENYSHIYQFTMFKRISSPRYNCSGDKMPERLEAEGDLEFMTRLICLVAFNGIARSDSQVFNTAEITDNAIIKMPTLSEMTIRRFDIEEKIELLNDTSDNIPAFLKNMIAISL